MKKRQYFMPTKEIQDLFNYEWKRAKHGLKPLLDHKKIPHLYTGTHLGGAIGIHFGRDGLYSLKLAKRWIHNSHAIAIDKDLPLDKMKHTMRHEIVHVIEQNHGSRFKLLLKALEDSRALDEKIIGQ